MFEGLFQPVHLLIIALVAIEAFLVPVCVFLLLLKVIRIDSSLKAVLTELQLQRKDGGDPICR